MAEVRCPMPECRRRIDLDRVPPVPEQPETEPCLHYIAAWGPAHGGMAEAVLWALGHARNREFYIRNLRVAEVSHERIEQVRPDLEAAARRLAHVVDMDSVEGRAERQPEPSARPEPVEGRTQLSGALFGDQFERDQVAFAYAQLILGPDPTLPPGRG